MYLKNHFFSYCNNSHNANNDISVSFENEVDLKKSLPDFFTSALLCSGKMSALANSIIDYTSENRKEKSDKSASRNFRVKRGCALSQTT